MMQFESTRGNAPIAGFEEVLLRGLAPDGGLYLPTAWPQFSNADWRALRGKPYAEIAFAVMAPFVETVIDADRFRAMIDQAYGNFSHSAVAPLVQLDHNQWLLELFHGPTLAFKDVAMQILAPMMDWALQKNNRTATVIGATSGDTGSAAIHAFKSSARCSIFILHPKGRVSDVQRRQMTTVDAPHVHNLAVDGDFDDCQALVKAAFNDGRFRNEVALSGVNSINWARIMPQIVYYVTSALALGAPDRSVSFSVPTGNFGDVFAGLVAKRMGLPIERLVIATNVNDILHRALTSGRYEKHDVIASTSPSMDIQISSNFERALFEAYGRDADAVSGLMNGLQQSHSFTIGNGPLAKLQSDFTSVRADEAEVAACMAQTLDRSGQVIDPHTAVGVHAAASCSDHNTPMITLATAHAAKFPQAVKAATDISPALPIRCGNLYDLPEYIADLPNELGALKAFIAAHRKE